MTGAVATHLQKINSKKPFHMAMLIPMAGFICAWIYPVYVNIFNSEVMDVHRETDVGIIVPSDKEMALDQIDSHVKPGQHVTTIEDRN